MSVNIRQKPKGSGVWWIFISHKGKRTSKKIGRDKKKAKEFAIKIEAKLALNDLGIIDKTHSPTFGKYALTFINVTLPTTCKISTQNNYIIPAIKNDACFMFS